VGNFYVNYSTRGRDREAVAECLRSAKRKAFVSPTINDTTVVFDEGADTQDEAIIKDVGKRISKVLAAPVLAVINHDDDILAYWLFEGGEISDEYNSCPGYFSDEGGDTPEGGDAKKICSAFGVPAKAKQVEKILRDEEEYVFALDRHKALAELLQHPWPYVCMGYGYIKEGSFAEGISAEDLLAVG
jgi:hypothetical protein